MSRDHKPLADRAREVNKEKRACTRCKREMGVRFDGYGSAGERLYFCTMCGGAWSEYGGFALSP